MKCTLKATTENGITTHNGNNKYVLLSTGFPFTYVSQVTSYGQHSWRNRKTIAAINTRTMMMGCGVPELAKKSL